MSTRTSVPDDGVERILFSPVIEVQTNVPNRRTFFGFKYGLMSFALENRLDESPNRVSCQLRLASFPDETLPADRDTVYYYGIRGNPGADQVFLTRPLPSGTAVLSISGLSRGTPKVEFNRGYDIWSSLRFTQVSRPVIHLESVLETALLLKGIVPVHAGCILQGESAHLLMAPPDTGKSSTVMQLIEQGYEYGGEDLILLDGRTVYPIPFTATIVKRETLPLHERIVGLAWRMYGEKSTVYQSLGMSVRKFAPGYQLANIYVLARSSRSSCQAIDDRSSIRRRILMWNRMELSYHQDKTLRALITLNESLPTLDDLMLTEASRLQQMVQDAANVFLIEAQTPDQFAALIQQTLR